MIVPLRDATESARYGGKAAALAKALRASLPVPDGFAIDWESVERIVAGDTHAALQAFRTSRHPESAKRDEGSRDGRTPGSSRSFAVFAAQDDGAAAQDDGAAAQGDGAAAQGDGAAAQGDGAAAQDDVSRDSCRGSLAVRSSAVDEDSLDASFAGQHATILGVTTEDAFLDAVRSIHASAHADSVREYRARMNLPGEPRIAIVVQRLVNADVAGVLFTRDPVTGADMRVIESAWGLGESVVAGLVTPDRFRIGPKGVVVARVPGAKEIAIRYAEGGGTIAAQVEDIDIHRLSLTDPQLAKLDALAAQCERFFGGPQDLEWAFAGGELFLLQSRPVTTIEAGISVRRFAGLGLAALLAPLNSTIIAVALPSIAGAFSASGALVTRTLVTAYLVVSIVAQSPAGKIADLWGYSRVLTLGRALFGLGALLAAFSPHLAVLGTGRVLMALGGALSIPTVFAELRNSVPAAKRGRVFGIFGAIMGTAAAVGPLIGGFLTSRYGWHSVFVVNLPVVALSLLLEPPQRRDGPAGSRRPGRQDAGAPRFDVLGSVLLAVAVVLLVAAVETQPLLAIGAVLVTIAFILRELRVADPVLDVRLFTRMPFAAGSAIVALQNLAMYSMIFLLPFFLTRTGATPAMTGRMLLLFTASMVIASPLGGRLSDALGARAIGTTGALVGTAGAALFVYGNALIPSLILLGMGIGLSTSPSQAAALSAVDAKQAGVASGALSTMRYVGGVIGSGLVASMVSNGNTHDARLIVFPLVLLASMLAAVLLPPRH